MTTKRVEIPPKLLPVFTPPRGEVQYRCAYGGRGSGKSYTFAKMAAIFGAVEKLRILCTRELQNSIRESFHAEVKAAIAADEWLSAQYDVGVDYIRGKNGTEFIFRGLRHNASAIKSLSQIDICIIEEAEDVPENSWLLLEPTIRSDKSEIWVIWNPMRKDSPVDTRFRKHTPPRSVMAQVNYTDNPWLPAKLDEQRKHNSRTMDDATYAWVWDGQYREISDAQIFARKFKVQEFTPTQRWIGPYFGLDFGFSQDPTAAVETWIYGRILHIYAEAGRVGLELDETASYIKSVIPTFGSRKIRADSSRPDSISYLARHGLPSITGAVKGKGSVEDGIEHIKSFDQVIIHPRCEQTIHEFRTYSYKVDKLTGEVLPDIVDANNHYIDAIRYALEGVRTQYDYSALL